MTPAREDCRMNATVLSLMSQQASCYLLMQGINRLQHINLLDLCRSQSCLALAKDSDCCSPIQIRCTLFLFVCFVVLVLFCFTYSWQSRLFCKVKCAFFYCNCVCRVGIILLLSVGRYIELS